MCVTIRVFYGLTGGASPEISPHLVSLCFSAVPVILHVVYNKHVMEQDGGLPVQKLAAYIYTASEIGLLLTYYEALRIKILEFGTCRRLVEAERHKYTCCLHINSHKEGG